jgi:hypothetical protein
VGKRNKNDSEERKERSLPLQPLDIPWLVRNPPWRVVLCGTTPARRFFLFLQFQFLVSPLSPSAASISPGRRKPWEAGQLRGEGGNAGDGIERRREERRRGQQYKGSKH